MDTLIWRQSSDLFHTGKPEGFEPIDVPPMVHYRGNAGVEFVGLGINAAYASYSLLDGTGTWHAWFWCSVGEIMAYGSGTPGYDGKVADTETLYILGAGSGMNLYFTLIYTQQNMDKQEQEEIIHVREEQIIISMDKHASHGVIRIQLCSMERIMIFRDKCLQERIGSIM